jgi:hypothetical protein
MAAATQDPPHNLLTGVWRRRRLHLRRVGAGGAAAVAAIAIAVPSVLQSTGGGRTGSPAATATPARAAPGSELLKCGMYTIRGISGGELSAHWKSSSIQAGPVWFVFARNGGWGTSRRLPGGRLAADAGVIVAVRNGTTAEITTPQPDRFRFLTRQGAHGRYTLRDGVPGITLAGCRSYRIAHAMPESYAAGLTLFYLPLGYVTDLTGCLPVQIRTPPSWKARWTAFIPLNGGTCTGLAHPAVGPPGT